MKGWQRKFWKPGLSRRERMLLLACNLTGFLGAAMQAVALYFITQRHQGVFILLQGAGLLVLLAGLGGQCLILYRRARAEYLIQYRSARKNP